jgi:hypothetical protein
VSSTRSRAHTVHAVALALLGLLFAAAAVSDFQQVAERLGNPDDPALLTVMHATAGALAGAAVYGIVRRRPWTPWVALAWGAVDTLLLATLPALVGLHGEERNGIWTGAVTVALVGVAIAAYLRRRLRPQ